MEYPHPSVPPRQGIAPATSGEGSSCAHHSPHAGGAARATPAEGAAPTAPADGAGAARLVGRAAMAMLLGTLALAAQPPARFSLGDSRERVRQVQGAPDVIERLASLRREVWSYGASTVTFDPRTGYLVEFEDPARRLKVTLAPGSTGRGTATARAGDTASPRPSRTQRHGTTPSAAPPLTIGASRADVVRQLGTPWAYTRDAGARHAFLAYGRSIVRLSLDGDTVSGWIVRDSSIRVDARDLAAGEAAMGLRRATPSAGPASAPATLRASVAWRDDDGDGVVSPGEGARVTLAVRNDGPGVARDVRGVLRVESPATGVSVQGTPVATSIASGSDRRFSFRLTADSAQGAAEIVAVVGATESNGFDLAPSLRLRIPARPAGAPRIVLREVRIDDASRDGRLAPREVADLTVRVANTGSAPTSALRGRLLRGTDLVLAAGARDTFALGAIDAGAQATITVGVFTNTRALDTALHLELADSAGRLVARLPIHLPVTGRASGVLDVAVAPDSEAPRRPAPREGDRERDIERDIPPAATRRPDAVAVVLGVERYRRLPDARFAERDAALMRRYAVEALGVNDDVEHLYYRSGADVTTGELHKLFGETGWLARRVSANTDLVVYWAGHGAPDAARRTPFLLPFDADPAFVTETGYSLGDLYDRLARLPARSITIILDACFTGLTRDGQALVRGARPTVLSIEHPALVRRQMAVISAARGTETAGDLPEVRHGLLTYWVARGLRGEADADGDGAITVAELGRFAGDGVSVTAARQDREQHPLVVARDSLTIIARLAPHR